MLAGSEAARTSLTLIARKNTFQLQGRLLELQCQGRAAMSMEFLFMGSNLNVNFVDFVLTFLVVYLEGRENFFLLLPELEEEEESCFLWVFKSFRKELLHKKRFHLDLT